MIYSSIRGQRFLFVHSTPLKHVFQTLPGHFRVIEALAVMFHHSLSPLLVFTDAPAPAPLARLSSKALYLRRLPAICPRHHPISPRSPADVHGVHDPGINHLAIVTLEFLVSPQRPHHLPPES